MTASISARVARRYLARDFPSDKALEKYLEEHPKADKSKHHVVEHEEHGAKDEHGGHDEGHGDSEHSEGHGEHGEHGEGHGGHGGHIFSRLKGHLKEVAKAFKKAPAEVQKFIADPKHRRESLRKGLKSIKEAGRNYPKQLLETAKGEVKEYKMAGQGVAAYAKGKKPTHEQKHAMREAAIHIALTVTAACLTASTPLLAAAIAGKSLIQHIAVKAAAKSVGSDAHQLHEMHHIGHHAVEFIMDRIAAAKKDGEDVDPMEIFAALIIKQVARQLEDLDDNTLAEGLSGKPDPNAEDDEDSDSEDEDSEDEDDDSEDDEAQQQQKQAARVAKAYQLMLAIRESAPGCVVRFES